MQHGWKKRFAQLYMYDLYPGFPCGTPKSEHLRDQFNPMKASDPPPLRDISAEVEGWISFLGVF